MLKKEQKDGNQVNNNIGKDSSHIEEKKVVDGAAISDE
jgi:hypothetical protein